jgi:hypothetical protein
MEVGFVVLGYIALFSMWAVLGWAKQRRKEREAFYRYETEKKLIDKNNVSVEQILRLRNEDEYAGWLRRREGLKLGGLITTAIGLGGLMSLRFFDTDELVISPFSWIPLGIGLVILFYVYVLYPKHKDINSKCLQPPLNDTKQHD